MTDNTNGNITLSRTANNMLAMQFPSKAAQNAFLESMGGQQFFPADARFNAGKPCPASIDEANNVVYFNGYISSTGNDSGSLAVAFANETMRNNFYQTIFATNESNRYARGYEGSPSIYIAALGSNSRNNSSIQLNLSQTKLPSMLKLNENNDIKPHEQVVISPQEAKKYWEYMQKVHFELVKPAAGYTSKQLGLIENLERALLSISEGKDSFNASFGGQGRYLDGNLPSHPNEALLYIMDQKNYDPLPTHVKAILGNIRNDIIHRERILNPRFAAEQDALKAAKPLIDYLVKNATGSFVLAIRQADERRNSPLSAAMESLGFKITYGRSGLEFKLMNHEFNADLYNSNNVSVNLNFSPGQETLNKIQPEKVALLISQLKSLEEQVNNKVIPHKPQLPSEKPLSQEQKQVISDFTQTHNTKNLLKESHVLHHQNQTGVFTQFDGAQNNTEKKEVKMIGKQIEHLNNPKHTPTSISTTINDLEKNIDSAAQKNTPQKQKNSAPTFQKSGFKEFLKQLKQDLQTLRQALGLKSNNKLSNQNAKKTQLKRNRR